MQKQKRDNWMNDVYHRVDTIMHEVQCLDKYTLLFVTNKLMGIDGSLWEGGHNGVDRSQMRKSIS